MFSRKCVCKLNISKIVRPLLAALSVNGLIMPETLANGYSSESTQRELSDEYQHDRVLMVIKNLCLLVIWTKVASALLGLSGGLHRTDAKHIRLFL